MSRIFLVGDTHLCEIGDCSKISSRRFPVQKDLTKNDYIILLGDTGFLWDKSKQTKYWENWFNNKNFTTLFLHGNHDNIPKLNKLPEIEMLGGIARKLNDSIFYLLNGQVYTINGKTFFVMGGGYSFDKKFRTEGKSWWREEMPSTGEYLTGLINLSKYNYKVDYILSHTCSHSEFSQLKNIYFEFNAYKDSSEEDPLRDYLQRVLDKVDYKHHYFGHFHKDYIDLKWSILYDRVIELGEEI